MVAGRPHLCQERKRKSDLLGGFRTLLQNRSQLHLTLDLSAGLVAQNAGPSAKVTELARHSRRANWSPATRVRTCARRYGSSSGWVWKAAMTRWAAACSRTRWSA